MNKRKNILIASVILLIIIVLGIWIYKTQTPGTAAKTVPIAVLTDLSSYTSEYGQQELAGLESLIDVLKADTSTKTKSTFQLVVQDTKGSPKDAVSAIKQILAKEKAPIYFSALSSVSMAILPVIEQEQSLTLCNATTADVVKNTKFSIRNFPDPSQEVDTLYKGAIYPLNIKSVGILYINDEYGKSMAELVKNRGNQGQIPESLYSEAYGFETSDFRSLISKLIASKAEAIICVGYGSQIGSAIRQIRENGYNGKILVPSLIVNTESVMKAAGSAIENTIFNGFEYQEGSPELTAFRKSFMSRYKGAQSDIGVLAYVGMKIVVDNYTPSASASETLKRIESTQTFNTILGRVTFVDRSFVYPLNVYVVKGGRVNAYKP